MSLTNLGSQRPRDRADVVRRDRARAAGRRRRSPGLPEPVRADRVRPEHRRAPGDPPATIRATRSRSGPPTSRPSRARPAGVIQYETDRARFLGRGRSVRSPVSVIDGRPLSNTVGAVLDPIFSLRLPGHARTRRDRPRDLLHRRRPIRANEVLDLADKYRESATFERAGDPGVDAGPGPAPSPRDRAGRGPPLPAPGQPDPLLGSVAASAGGAAGQQRARRVRVCGPTASPATCPSSWCGSTRWRTSTSCASCSAPTSTGG